MPGRRTLLIVEDEESIVVPLAEALDREGFDTEVAGTVAGALQLGRPDPPDLVLLDVMPRTARPRGLPRATARPLPSVIFLTARGQETDRSRPRVGADDYIVKPFSAREVAARIRAVLRRAGAPESPGEDAGPLHVGELRLDPARRSAALGGTELDLTRREFDLLELLMREAGAVVSREAANR